MGKIYKTLTHADKLEVQRQSRLGISGTRLADKYNVSTATISRIKAANLTTNEYSGEYSQASKQMRCSKLDDFLVQWMRLYRSEDVLLNGPSLCAKTLSINEKYNLSTTFKVRAVIH